MEQKAPFPLIVVDEELEAFLGGFVNSDCRSCHYDNVVPRDRFVPIGDRALCESKGGVWKANVRAYYPYEGYPYMTGDPLPYDAGGNLMLDWVESNRTPCVKFEAGRGMYPKDWRQTDDNAYYALPERLPGWHSETMACTECHLAFGTKDLDGDSVPDRYDMCPGTNMVKPGVEVDLNPESPTYGCAVDQEPGDGGSDEHETARSGYGKRGH
ncbi:hypothetical protein [Desulfoluna limicola]|nr:hypothetical protein [Desulfoluna limicola]